MRLYNDIVISGDKAILRSYAKVNLTLDVLGKRNNGYHDVAMIMQTINLYDNIIVSKAEKGIKLTTNCNNLPTDSSNIAYKAAQIFFDYCNICAGADIYIEKNIPIAAGLAGGSSNAAGVLCALNLLYETALDDEELICLGTKIGADVPFCIIGGTCLAEGIGEKLTELVLNKSFVLLLVKPEDGVSTGRIYSEIDSDNEIVHPNTQGMIEAIKTADLYRIAGSMANVMESVTVRYIPEIASIKRTMLECGAVGCVMSGSGPTVYGLFEDTQAAIKAGNVFREKYKEVFVTRTYN